MRMVENSEYVIHNDYNKIIGKISDLVEVDENILKKIRVFVAKIKAVDEKLKPAMRKQPYGQDERELWKTYQKLQGEKLEILDLLHEWDYLEETSSGLSREVKLLIRDAIEELQDHVITLTETQKAHIDILEIKNTRQLGLLALVVSIVISYAAVWEFFVRDILFSVKFPFGLSPDLNVTVTVISLIPIFATIIWGWRHRIAD
jgi:hypothetical protein